MILLTFMQKVMKKIRFLFYLIVNKIDNIYKK